MKFHRNKFRELILYVADQTKDDPGFGDTHLNKVLYWSDFFAYSHMGHPITGARYFKLQFGPAAKPLVPVRDELVEEGALKVVQPPPGTKEARKTLPRRSPNTNVFTREELKLVDEVIAQLKGRTATAVSRRSHREAGWRLVELYEDIPYETALIARDAAPAEVRTRAEELVAAHGW